MKLNKKLNNNWNEQFEIFIKLNQKLNEIEDSKK